MGERLTPPAMVADDTREEFYQALLPIWRGVQALLQSRPGLADPWDVRLIVQPFPLIVRVFKAGDAAAGVAAVELSRGPGRALPDGGAALEAAVVKVLAGVLSALGEDDAALATRIAASLRGQGGGFVVGLDPTDGIVWAQLVDQGQALHEAIVLGGIADPTVAH